MSSPGPRERLIDDGAVAAAALAVVAATTAATAAARTGASPVVPEWRLARRRRIFNSCRSPGQASAV